MENETNETQKALSANSEKETEALSGAETETGEEEVGSNPSKEAASGSDYSFDLPEGVDKSLADNFDKTFVKFAKEAGVQPKAAKLLRQKMLGELSAMYGQRRRDAKAFAADQDKKLREEWKDGYDQKKQSVISLVEKLDGGADGEFARYIAGTGLVNDACFMKNMAKIASVLSEDKNLFGGGGTKKEETIEDYIVRKGRASE